MPSSSTNPVIFTGSEPLPVIVKQKACIPCRTRKVKCNKATPCHNCSQWDLDCTYPSSVRRCRRPPKKLPSPSPETQRESPNSQASQALERRIESLETCLAAFGATGTRLLSNSVPESSNSIQESRHSGRLDAIERDISNLASQQSRYLPLQSTKTFDSCIIPRSPCLEAGMVTQFLQPTLMNSFSKNTSHLHLFPIQAEAIWKNFQIYLDPVLKVVHKPTAERILVRSVQDSSSLSTNQAALVFSIHLSSIFIMSEESVQIHFGATKTIMLTTYLLAAENALMRGRILGSHDIIALQAIVLFITISMKLHKPRLDWPLKEISKQLATSSGDKVCVLEREIHNRLAWHLWYMDHRAANDDGKETTLLVPHPKEMPLNMNDADLKPSDHEANCGPGWTDISFALLRFELAQVACKLEDTLSTQQQNALIDQCEQHIHSCYLDYCESTSPLGWLAHHITYFLIMEMRFKVRQQQTTAPAVNHRQIQGDADHLILAAADILDIPRRLKNEPLSTQWTWLLPPFHHFIPLQFLLSELCSRTPNHPVAQHAWSVVEPSFTRWSTHNKETTHHLLLTNLMDMAKERRQQMDSHYALQTPILQYVFGEPPFWAVNGHPCLIPNYPGLGSEAKDDITAASLLNYMPQGAVNDSISNSDTFDVAESTYLESSTLHFSDDQLVTAFDHHVYSA